MAVKIAIIEPPRKLCKKPCKGQGALKIKTQNGSISTITLATSKVGKSKILNRSSPIQELGPQWNGVNGIILFFIRFYQKIA